MTQHFTTPPPIPATSIPLPEHMKRKPRRWFTKPVVILPVAALVLGLGLGSMNRPDPVQVAVPGPERIVNHDVRVSVPTTPAECATAIDLYEQLTDYTSEALGYTQDAMVAASTFDVAGINASTANVKKLTPKIQAIGDPLKAAKAACRAAQ